MAVANDRQVEQMLSLGVPAGKAVSAAIAAQGATSGKQFNAIVTAAGGTVTETPPRTITDVKNVPNADGSVTTIITYSDGTQDVSSTAPTTSAVTSSTTSNTQAITGTALDAFRAQLASAGLSSLVTVLDAAIKDNQTSSQIQDTIRNSQAYKDRFPGMADLQKKGQAINEAAYISAETGYTQTLHAYGLDTGTFATTAALGTYIANQISPAEFNTRVDAAANRVEKNPDVLAALQQYYPGASKAGVISYLLDPSLGMTVLTKEVRAAEIGAAAVGAGFTQFDLTRNINANAESLTTQIGTEDLTKLKQEFGAASVLNETQQRLATIEGGAYTSDTAIKATLVGDAGAQLESTRRAQREAARFGGQGSKFTRVSTVGSI